MGGFTSIFVRRDSETIVVSLRRIDENTQQPKQLNYNLEVVTTQTNNRDARMFVNQYIELLNILVMEDKLLVTKRNIRYYILKFLGSFLAVGDVISITENRYAHSRQGEELYGFLHRMVAEQSRSSGIYSKRRNANLAPIESYLQLVNSPLL
jgi:hypothetical protein